tara:strand:+ start:481 stop:1260 length:780 start_codon:yes stop_codon:yes gene_type:complete
MKDTIFIKNPRAASGAIATLFEEKRIPVQSIDGRKCGFWLWENITGAEDAAGNSIRLYTADDGSPVQNADPEEFLELCIPFEEGFKYVQPTSLAERIKKSMGYDSWYSHFKFTTTRNPWDRVVSMWKHPIMPEVNFETFVKSLYGFQRGICMIEVIDPVTDSGGYIIHPDALAIMWHTQQILPNIIDENRNILVNFIIRFEELQDGFDELCDIIEVPRMRLPHIMKSDRKDYHDYYTPELKRIVAHLFCDDIEYFGYEF